MNKKTVQRTIVLIIVLFLGYIGGVVSKNHSMAYNRPEYELVNFEFSTFEKTGDPQRRAKQRAERLEMIEEKIDKMGVEGWELHSFWGDVAIFER